MNLQAETINILNIPFAAAKIVREECYPYLAYISGEGNPCGKMFQSFVFDLSKGDTLACWESNLALLFAQEGGIGEIDSAVADLKSLFGLSKEVSYDIYVKAPVPKISLTLFGDINRDGIARKLLDVEDCVKAFSLFATDFIRHFEIGKYTNLNLKGFVLEPCGDDRALPACADYLAQRGISVFASGIETIDVSEKTDFSIYSVDNGLMRIFRTENPEFILSCAFSKNVALRDIYDSLYILLNPEKFFGNDEETVEETVEEMLVEEIREVVVEERVEEKEPEIEPASEEKRTEVDAFEIETTVLTEETISEEMIPENTKKIKCCQEIKLTTKQKNALIGAGIAAATLGLAYLVCKFTKD